MHSVIIIYDIFGEGAGDVWHNKLKQTSDSNHQGYPSILSTKARLKTCAAEIHALDFPEAKRNT